MEEQQGSQGSLMQMLVDGECTFPENVTSDMPSISLIHTAEVLCCPYGMPLQHPRTPVDMTIII